MYFIEGGVAKSAKMAVYPAKTPKSSETLPFAGKRPLTMPNCKQLRMPQNHGYSPLFGDFTPVAWSQAPHLITRWHMLSPSPRRLLANSGQQCAIASNCALRAPRLQPPFRELCPHRVVAGDHALVTCWRMLLQDVFLSDIRFAVSSKNNLAFASEGGKTLQLGFALARPMAARWRLAPVLFAVK